jgi:thiamine-monophosphate kinase
MSGQSKTRAGELDLIERVRRRVSGIASEGLRLGIGDDCALLRPKSGEELAITTDLSIAGRHFQLDWHSPKSVGHRTLARGLSDLAAMGARPLAAFVSLGLPRELTVAQGRRRVAWIDSFYDGFLALAEAHKCPLAGGDLAESPLAVADIVLVGAVKRRQALLRSGARIGDQIYVTGALGGAEAGLTQLSTLAAEAQPGKRLRIPKRLEALLAPHLYPQPRLAQGLWLVKRRVATAAIDLSDGLSTDLAHLCDESHVAAVIDAVALPVAPGADLNQALHGGEDYELLFTAPPTAHLPRAIAGVPVTRIGRIVRRRADQPQVTLLASDGSRPLEHRGWQHFA